MNIAIGADHRGFECKAYLKQYVVGAADPIAWIDVGAFNAEYSDYPVFSQAVCQAIMRGEAERGVLICGSGVGMAIAANRYPKIYAGLAWNVDVAQVSHEHDNTNVLVLPSDFVTLEESAKIVEAWLVAKFKGGRYQERLEMIDRIKA